MLPLVSYCTWEAIFLHILYMGQCPSYFTSPRAGFKLCCWDRDAGFKGSFFVSEQQRQGLKGLSHDSKEQFEIFHVTEHILLSTKSSATQGNLVTSLRVKK